MTKEKMAWDYPFDFNFADVTEGAIVTAEIMTRFDSDLVRPTRLTFNKPQGIMITSIMINHNEFLARLVPAREMETRLPAIGFPSVGQGMRIRITIKNIGAQVSDLCAVMV